MEPSSCDVWATSVDLVSEVNGLLDAQEWVWGTAFYWQRSTCLVSGTKPKLTLFYHLCLGWGLGTGQYYVEQSTQNCFPVLCSFRIPGEKVAWLTGLWLVLILTLKGFVSWGKSFAVSSHEQLARLHEFFERIITHDWRGNGNPLQYSYLENTMNLVGCRTWGGKELDMTERLTT